MSFFDDGEGGAAPRPGANLDDDDEESSESSTPSADERAETIRESSDDSSQSSPDSSDDSSGGTSVTDLPGVTSPADTSPPSADERADTVRETSQSSGGTSQDTSQTSQSSGGDAGPPQASDRDTAGINFDAVDRFDRIQDAKGGDIQGHEAGVPIKSDNPDSAVGRTVDQLESETVTDLGRGDVQIDREQRNGRTFVDATLTDEALADERDERREVASGINQASDRDFAGINRRELDAFAAGDSVTAADEVFVQRQQQQARQDAVDDVERQLEEQTGADDLERGADFTVSETDDGISATLTDEGTASRGLDPAFVPDGDVFRDDLDEGVELGKTSPLITATVTGARAVNDLQDFDERSRERGIQNRATVEQRTRETVPQTQLSGQPDEPDPLSGSGPTFGETAVPAAQQTRQDALTTLGEVPSVELIGGATDPDPTAGDGPQVSDGLETGATVASAGTDVRLTGDPTDSDPLVADDAETATVGDASSGDLPASASAPVATGAALNPAVGAGILAGAAIATSNPSELETPERAPGSTAEIDVPEEAGPVSELEPGSTQPAEIGTPDSPLPTTSELETPDRAPGSTAGGELPISASQLIQERPEREQTPEIDEGDIVTGIGQPDQPGPSTRERQERDDLFSPERTFPTGEGSVVGRSVSEEDVTEPSVTRDRASEDATPGFGAGSSPFSGVFGGVDGESGTGVGLEPASDVFDVPGAAQTPRSDVQSDPLGQLDTPGLGQPTQPSTTGTAVEQTPTEPTINLFGSDGTPRGGQGRLGGGDDLPPSESLPEEEAEEDLFATGIESGEEVFEGAGFDVDDELNSLDDLGF